MPAILCLGLAACVSSTPNPEPEPEPGPDPISFGTFAEGQTIATDIEAANIALGLMNPADLLTTGTASYQGTAEIESTAGLNAIGVASLTVILETGSEGITGSATDFVDDTDNAVSGALGIVGGSFDRSGPAGGNVTASVSGNFDGTTHVLQAQSQISGDFYGDAEGLILEGAVAGFVDGQATTYDITIITEVTPD
jgi:hypothetical protein